MIVTTKQKIRAGVAQHWKEQYYRRTDKIWSYPDKEAIYEKLKALPKTATDADIRAVIGNGSWTRNRCDECGEDVEVAVLLGQEPDHESATVSICPKCLRKALKLIKETPNQKGR